MYIKNGCQHELTEEAKKQIYTIQIPITGEQIENIIVTALEGGIGYWACLNNATPEWNNKLEGLPASQYAAQLIFEGKTVEFTDAEDEDVRWDLDLPRLLNGIRQNAEAESGSIDLDDIDAEIADCIIQYALFGELVYG